MSVRILTGDCRSVLASLPEKSVQCCVTSPPYYGLRSYGIGTENGEIGLEQSPDSYVAEMVAVFREIRRVLADTGVVFLNLGDSYCGAGYGNHDVNGARWKAEAGLDRRSTRQSDLKRACGSLGIKPKDLLGIPWMVAFALRADGWWLRSAITWCKTAPMPENVVDRPTSATEMVFLLAKSGSPTHWLHRDGPGTHTEPEPDYRWIDQDNDDTETAVEPHGWRDAPSAKHSQQRRWRRVNLWRGRDYFYDPAAIAEESVTNDPRRPYTSQGAKALDGRSEWKSGQSREGSDFSTRNARNWWVINPQPYSGAHFATMPPDLAERCVRAGSSERGQCPHCGAPWARVVERSDLPRDMARPQARRAVELYEAAGLTPQHIAAIRACGVTDAGKATVTQTGYGKNTANMQRLATEAKAALGGYHREFLLAGEETTGWSPTCACPAHTPVPQTVLDPFGGAGTTGLVADRLGRNAVLIELNPDYAKLARNRVTADAPLFAEVAD